MAAVVLAPLAIIFAVWGAYGIVNLNITDTTYAAKGDGIQVTSDEARQVWSQQQAQWAQRLGQQEFPQPLVKRFRTSRWSSSCEPSS